MILSPHAAARIQERVGLKRKAIPRHIKHVFAVGLDAGEMAGDMRHWVESKMRNQGDRIPRVHGSFLYVFDYNKANPPEPVCVTVLDIPKEIYES